jgi:lactate dehydrogenase-like 2-hydroxyacid dehydrogenase
MDNVVLTPHTASYSDKTMEIQRRRTGQDARGSLGLAHSTVKTGGRQKACL